MPDKQNIVAFPRSAKKRKLLLREAENSKLRRLTRLRSAVGWLLTLTIVLFTAVNFTMFTPSAIVRTFGIVRSALGRDDGSAEGTVDYPTGAAGAAAPIAGGLAVLDDEALTVLHLGGAVQQQTPMGYSAPVLQANGSYLLAFDRGAYNITLASPLTPLIDLTLTSPILNASLGADGSFAVVTDETGYKSAVTVYSTLSREEDHHLWRWRTPDFYVQDAALSPSGAHLCALTFRQNEAALETTLQFFDLNSASVRATVSLDSAVGYTVRWLDDSHVAVITDQAAFVVDRRGEKHTVARYSPSDLMGFAFGGDSFVLAQRSWSGTSRADLTRFDKAGEARATVSLPAEPQSLSFAGDRVGVLTANGLYVYTSALRPDWKNESAGTAQRVTMTADGGAWLYYPKYAQRVTSSSARSEEFRNDP